jgi:hypothetical protein
VEGSADDEYDRVISVNEDLDAINDTMTSLYSVDLSTSTYEIGMFSFDDKRGTGINRSAQNQEYEIFNLRFDEQNPDDAIWQSWASDWNGDDIPDESQLGTSTNLIEMDMNQGWQSMRFLHSLRFAPGVSKSHDLTVGCVGIDRQSSNPSTSISASTTSIPYNGSTTLEWTYSNAVSGTTTSNTGNTQWANTDAVSGCASCAVSDSKQITNLTEDTEFTLAVDGSYGGTASDSVAVDVADKPVDIGVDLDTVNVGGSTTLAWSTTNMDTCVASSQPTDDDWTAGRNPDPSGGNQELTNVTSTTDYTLTCEDTSQNKTVSDTATVGVSGFDLSITSRDIWGVQLAGSVTTQALVKISETNFTDDVQLSVSPVGGTGIGASFQFLDDNGNPLSGDTLTPPEFDDGTWLQAQLGTNIAPGRTTLEITAEAVNSTTSASEQIDMHIRSIGEQ